MRREELDALAERLSELLTGLEREAPPGVVETVAELLDGVQRVHAEGLRRLAELLAEDRERFGRALDDPVIANLFVLHDLALVDERGRAEAALEAVRPLARSHGGEIELVDVEEGVVTVRLHGACHGCPSSTATLRGGIERMLAEKLPGFVRLEVAETNRRSRRAGGAGSATGDVSVVPEETLVRMKERLSEGRSRGSGPEPGGEGEGNAGRTGPRWVEVLALDDLPREGLFATLVGNFPLLLVTRADGVAAFRNACPGSILPLHLGGLEEGVVVCPWHGCRFDTPTGERRDAAGPPLERLACATVRGRVRVKVP